jgi:hypothetical protein
MAQPDVWTQKLGWLGAFLAGQDARHVEILNRDTFVTVAWERPGGGRQQTKFNTEELLRPWAPYKLKEGSSSRSGLLSAVGREVDLAGIDVASIMEEDEGFLVVGSIRGRYQHVSLSYAELLDPVGASTTRAQDETFVDATTRSTPLRQRLHLSS